MFYATLSLWFLVSGNPSHINQERFSDRLTAQRAARTSPATSVAIWCVTTCPEEAWALEDTRAVKRFQQLQRLAKHGRAASTLLQISPQHLFELTSRSDELRSYMVELIVFVNPEAADCPVIKVFKEKAIEWEYGGDCDEHSIVSLWSDTRGRLK